MRSRIFLTLSFACLLCPFPVSADTILLNDGKSIEGKIIFEDPTYYLVEVPFSEGIMDEKKIMKSDIKSISKLSPDIEEFAKFKGLVPAPDLTSQAEYEARVKKLQDFITKYPTSQKLAEVRKMSDTLKEELVVVQAGGFKFSGKMISAEEYQSNAYAYDESILSQKIMRDISNRNFLGALRLFTEYETNFVNGKSRDELVAKIKQVLQVYKTNLTESLASFDSRMKARLAGLDRMTSEDRVRTEKALEEEAARLEERFDREKAIKNLWITPDENHKESITEAIRQVENEIRRLETPPKNQLVLLSLDEEYRNAWNLLPVASEDESKKIFENLKRNRMPESYISKLKTRAGSGQ